MTLVDTKVMRIKEQSLLKIFGHKDEIIKTLHFLRVNKYFTVISILSSHSQNYKKCN
jgi:hypothetical protein